MAAGILRTNLPATVNLDHEAMLKQGVWQFSIDGIRPFLNPDGTIQTGSSDRRLPSLFKDAFRDVRFSSEIAKYLKDGAGAEISYQGLIDRVRGGASTGGCLSVDDAEGFLEKAVLSWLESKGLGRDAAGVELERLKRNYVQNSSGAAVRMLWSDAQKVHVDIHSKSSEIDYDISSGWRITSKVFGPITVRSTDNPGVDFAKVPAYGAEVIMVENKDQDNFKVAEVRATLASAALIRMFARTSAAESDVPFTKVKKLLGSVAHLTKLEAVVCEAKSYRGVTEGGLHAIADAALAEARISGMGQPGVVALTRAVKEAHKLASGEGIPAEFDRAARAVAHRSGLYTAMTVLGVAVLATAAAAGVVALTAATGGAGGVAAIALAATFHSTVAAWACAVGGVLGLGAMVGVGVARRRAGLRTWGMTEGVTSVAMREFGKAKAAQGATATAFRRERVVPVEVSAAASIAGAAAAASAVGVTPAE